MVGLPHWMLDDLPVGVWIGRVPGGEVVYANREFRRIVGMDAVVESRVGDASATYHVRDRAGNPFPEEDLPFSRAVAERKAVIIEGMVLHRPDAGQVCIRAFATPRIDETGETTHVTVAFIDINKEVATEAERDTVEARLALAVNHAPIAIWAADPAGTVTLSEGAGLAALGVKSGQLVGQSLFELYAQHPTIPGFIRRGLAGESFSYTVQVGEAVYDTWLTPLRGTTGEIVGLAGLSHDVSEIRRLQGQTIQNDRIIAMGTLAASVAHEINNPLTYVLGSAQVLVREVARLEVLLAFQPLPMASILAAALRIKAELEPVTTGLDRMALITHDLRTFSRPDDQRLETVDVMAVLRSVLQLMGKEVEARATLTVDLGPAAPARANQARLVQVFLNLLTNALQAVTPGRPNQIGVVGRVDNGRVIVEVSDTGRGVPEGLRERIFEPFVTTKEVGEGTGLGLFVCRNILSGYGGHVSVHDRPGGGAVFRVSLPAVALQHEPSLAAAHAASASPPTSGRRILIIDDEPMVARALLARLKDAGYAAMAVEAPARAMDLLLSNEDIALVYCDLMMKGMTGMALDGELRARAPDQARKLVFMTGGAFTPEAQAFVEANADRVITKPFDIVAETARRWSGDGE